MCIDSFLQGQEFYQFPAIPLIYVLVLSAFASNKFWFVQNLIKPF